MKKLMILGLMLSLFTFGESKNEVKNIHAEEVTPQPGSSATFPSGINGSMSIIELESYYEKIVSIKVSNDSNDLPLASDLVCEPILLHGSQWDGNGNLITPEGEPIYAYIFEPSDSAPENIRYDCVLYANAEKIYSNPDASFMFDRFTALEDLDIKLLDTSKTTIMIGFFQNCYKLEHIDVSNMDTSNVTDMGYMFCNCESLKKIDVSNFNTSNVESTVEMFGGCHSLTELDLSKWNTSSFTNMNSMFQNCDSLKNINVESFDTHNVTNMDYLFGGCSSLTELDLSNFNTSKVKQINYMFIDCTSLKKVDLSSFDLSAYNDETYSLCYVFQNCDSLEYVKSPKVMPADSTTNNKHAITLPSRLADYYGVTTLTSDNLAQYKELCILGDEFIKNWRALRTEGGDNGICAALVAGTEGNTKLTQLLTEYDAFDIDYQDYVNKAIDKDEVTIGESIAYIKNYLSLKQSTLEHNDASKEYAGSFITTSITDDSSYVVVAVALLGVIAVIAYYFIEKKRLANR